MSGVVKNLNRNSFPVEVVVEEAPKRKSFLGKIFGKKKEKTIDEVQISNARDVNILKGSVYNSIDICGECFIEHDDECHFS